jgi:two-component system, OmpR family, sensor histidine kinase MprB
VSKGVSLRTRLTVIVAVIVAAAVVGGAYAAHLSTQHALQDETDKFLHDRAAGFVRQPPGDLGGDFGGAPTDADDDHTGRYFEFDALQQTIDRNGTITNSLPNQSPLPIDAEDREIAHAQNESHYRNVTVDGQNYRMITASLRNGGAVQIARKVSETDDVLDVLRARLVIIALSGIAFAALAAWLVMRRATRPIEQLTDTAERIAETQDLATPIPVKGDDEVGRLAASFNTMLIALDTSREQQQRLVVDASHELRTPLTAVRTNIDFLGHATTLDAEQRAQLIAETRLELDELTNLVSEMVELATDVRSEEAVEPIVLADVVNDVATRFRRRTGTDITVTVVPGDGTEAGVVDGRRAMLDRAVANLVDNALKFSPSGAAVDVTVRGTTVEVADRGPGIDAEDRARVFDRFYRATSARTLPGSGLGLSIVSQIAALHGGTVTLDAREGGGTVARLAL